MFQIIELVVLVAVLIFINHSFAYLSVKHKYELKRDLARLAACHQEEHLTLAKLRLWYFKAVKEMRK